MRHDGRGDFVDQVVCAGAGCVAAKPVYRCSDCIHPCLYCRACAKSIHERTPFHHIEVGVCFVMKSPGYSQYVQEWDGTSFKRCSMKTLGVRIQLGHPLGDRCPNPTTSAGDDFVVINSHTIDQVGLDYCNCTKAIARSAQLLRMRLYPATGTNPRSAATFAALRRFSHMTFESKCSAYEFYNSLARETDNTGLEPSRASDPFPCMELAKRDTGALRRVPADDPSMAASYAAQTCRASS